MNSFNLKLMELISPVLKVNHLSHLKLTEIQKKEKFSWINGFEQSFPFIGFHQSLAANEKRK